MTNATSMHSTALTQEEHSGRGLLWFDWSWLLALGLAPWIVLVVVGKLVDVELNASGQEHVGLPVGAGVFLLVVTLICFYEWGFLAFARSVLKSAVEESIYINKFSAIDPKPIDTAATAAFRALKEAAAGKAPDDPKVAEKVVEALRRYVDNTEEPALSGWLEMMTQAADTSAKAAERRLERISYIRDHFQSRINDEYSDISSRIGWLMSGQAFLLGALVATLNASALGVEPKHWLSTGIALSGAITSGVLSVSTFLGHALIEKLKIPRGAAETIMDAEFHIPPAGVSRTDPAHQLGHAPTRYLPLFAYTGWVCLTLLALLNRLPGDVWDPKVLPYDALTHREFTRGWVVYEEPTPPFPIGQKTYEPSDKRCADNGEAAQRWVDTFIERWAKRPAPSAEDGLIVVGSADRMSLDGVLKRQLDSNMSLARGRAEEIKRRLVAETGRLVAAKALAPERRITSAHVLVLVTGPLNTDTAQKHLEAGLACNDTALAADRSVQVWIPEFQ